MRGKSVSNPGVTLKELLDLTERAVNGERQLLVQLFRELQRLKQEYQRAG